MVGTLKLNEVMIFPAISLDVRNFKITCSYIVFYMFSVDWKTLGPRLKEIGPTYYYNLNF